MPFSHEAFSVSTNYHTYRHSLTPWTLDSEIEKLSEHLKDCFDSPDTENSLWKYFSLSSKTPTVERPSTSDDKIDFLTMQVAALRKELENSRKPPSEKERTSRFDSRERLITQIIGLASKQGITVIEALWEGDQLEIITKKSVPGNLQEIFKDLALLGRINLKFRQNKE